MNEISLAPSRLLLANFPCNSDDCRRRRTQISSQFARFIPRVALSFFFLSFFYCSFGKTWFTFTLTLTRDLLWSREVSSLLGHLDGGKSTFQRNPELNDNHLYELLPLARLETRAKTIPLISRFTQYVALRVAIENIFKKYTSRCCIFRDRVITSDNIRIALNVATTVPERILSPALVSRSLTVPQWYRLPTIRTAPLTVLTFSRRYYAPKI